MRFLAFLCLGLTVGCGSDPSGLEVIVEADLEVANRSTRVAFEVRTQEGQVALQETFNIEQTPFPIRRLVAPRGGDASRVVTITAQAVNAAGDTLTTARIIRSFIPGRRVEVRLRLYELCLGTNCPEGLTCEPINGRAECVDARVIEGTADAGVDGDAPNVCPATQTSCDDKCVDTQSDEAHCGLCDRVCSTEQVCSNGGCQIISCSAPSDCSTGSYCNMNTGRCLPGCDEPSDCGDNSSCNMGANQCECATGYHPCSSACLPDDAVTSCGDRCAPCEGLSNGTASCQPSGDSFICASMCNDGFNLCNGTCALASSPTSCGPSCTVCPGSSRGTAICNAGSCSLLCNQGTTMCASGDGQDCVDTTSDANHCGTCGRVCTGGQICQGSNCIEPPNCDVNNPASCTGLTYCNPSNNRCAPGCDPRLSNQCGSNQTCTNNQCVCSSGTHECSGVCLSNSSVNSCGTSCTTCPLATNATQMGCNGTTCTVTSCIAGYQPNGQSCDDINECLMGNGGCQVNATCSNTAGSRTCACNPGTHHQCGDACLSNSSVNSCGSACSPCTLVTNAAQMGCNGTSCTVTSCTSGYQPSGSQQSCEDINECLSNNGGCHVNAMCTNIAGSRTCMCNPGFFGNGLVCMPSTSTSGWRQITGPGPSARRDHAMVYDSTLNRVVLFGGHGSNYRNDTWVLSGNTWSQITGPGPSVRQELAMVYDTTLNRVVLFGGQNSSGWLGDTWVLSGNTWSQITGPGPSARGAHAIAYDSTSNRVVLFGGYGTDFMNDTWVLSGSTWSQLTNPGPSERADHAVTYDSALSRVVLFGGHNGSSRFSDTWVLTGSTWTQVIGAGPTARRDHAMVYDTALSRVVLFGGDSGSRLSDTVVLLGSTWSQVVGAGPSARFEHAMAYDSAEHRVVLFGGDWTASGLASDTWVFE